MVILFLCMVYVLYIIDRARPLKLFHFVVHAFARAFTFQTCETRQRKPKCKRKDKKKTGFIVSMPPRRREVESKMAPSILYEKLAESVRKYPVLSDKRCTDKLKKTLA